MSHLLKRSHRPLLTALLAGSIMASAAPATAQTAPTGIPAWSIASADLQPDPAVRFGVLPNGMRYAVMRNETPKGAGALRFAFDIGTKEEADNERGYAHFLEHMAFNGSTNIPEGQLIPLLERLGLAFGADSNASTGLDATTYELDLPKTDAPTIEAGLKMMREIASNLTIAPDAVKREIGIIQSEARVRNTFARRQIASQIETLFPGHRVGKRLIITPEEIAKTTAPGLRAFYDGFYRPERATLVLVGDVDVDAMEKLIRERFADWKGRGAARASLAPAVVPAGPARIDLFVDPAVPEQVQLTRAGSYRAPSNDLAENRDDLLLTVAQMALTNRLSILSRDASSPIVGGQVDGADLFRTGEVFGIAVGAKEGRWTDALKLAEQEMRRADLHGFTEDEIVEAKARFESSLRTAVTQAPARQSGGLAGQLASAANDRTLVLSPAQRLALYQTLEKGMTRDAVAAAFRKEWAGGPTAVLVSTKSAVAGGETTVAATLDASRKVAVAAPVAKATKAFAYENFGTPGPIVSDKRIDDLGIRTLRFANGVTLNLKKTDFEPGRIVFRTEIGSGMSVFPANAPGLGGAFGAMAGVDGLKAHDIDELRRLTAGRQVSGGLAALPGAIVASGATTPQDLDFQMKLVAARVMAPAWSPATQTQWAAIAPVIAKTITSDPMQLTQSVLAATLLNGDARMGITDPSVMERVTMEQVRAVVQPQLDTGAIEVAMVGDLDEAAAIASVARTLGALPARTPIETKPAVAPMGFAKERDVRILRHKGAADQGVIALTWPTTDDDDFKSTVSRELLASVMQLRLLDVIREKLGATYTPDASAVASNIYDGVGMLIVIAPAQPSSMDVVGKAMRDIAAELAAKPVTADELLRARNPRIEAIDRQQRQNGSWLGVVADAQSKPVTLERWRTRKAQLLALTPADLQAEAKRWLLATPLEVRALPEGK